MRLLLDTHVVLWLVDDVGRLPDGWAEAITAADEVFVSAVVGWEIGVKRSFGRLTAPAPDDLLGVLEPLGYVPLAVTWGHAVASAGLPWHHRDPFDRLLVAQARQESLTLASVDEDLLDYDVTLLGA